MSPSRNGIVPLRPATVPGSFRLVLLDARDRVIATTPPFEQPESPITVTWVARHSTYTYTLPCTWSEQ